MNKIPLGWKSFFNRKLLGRNEMKNFRTILIPLFAVVLVFWGCGNGQTKKADTSESSSQSKLPFSNGGWQDITSDIAGRIFLSTERGVIFYAFDTLAYPNEKVDLAVKVQSKKLQAIEGITVGFFLDDEKLAEATTDKTGLANTQWTPKLAKSYELEARITKVKDDQYEKLEGLGAPLLVASRGKDTQFVVIDLDHTVVDSSFFRVLVGGAKPMAGSVQATKKIAEKYSIIYLTHRPDLLTKKSKTWLSLNDYPKGPLLVSELKEAFGDSGKFKTAKLKAVKGSYPNVRIGIGDKYSDAQAYVDNGLGAYLIPHYKEKPKDIRKAARQIRQLNGKGRLNVVSGWGEIEDGIFKGKKFPPEDFAKALDREAEKLEEEEKRRKREKDDDD